MKRQAIAVAAVLWVLAGCGRSDGFGGPAGSLPSLTSGSLSAGNGSGRSASSAGTGSISAGQGSAGQSGGSTSDIGGSTSNGQQAGTSAGFASTGTGGSSGTSGVSGGSTGTPGTGGTGATGTGGSGSTTGSGCDPNLLPNLEAKCTVDSDCGCKYTCVSDPPLGMRCEPQCLTLSDCPDLGYVCNGTYCQFNACGGDAGNGAFNSTCNVTGTDDGTCVPTKLNGTTIGKCYQGGTATTCCDANLGRPSSPAGSFDEICEAGFICSGPDGECGAICEPHKHECPQGEGCAFVLDDAITGGCFGQNICKSDGG